MITKQQNNTETQGMEREKTHKYYTCAYIMIIMLHSIPFAMATKEYISRNTEGDNLQLEIDLKAGDDSVVKAKASVDSIIKLAKEVLQDTLNKKYVIDPTQAPHQDSKPEKITITPTHELTVGYEGNKFFPEKIDLSRDNIKIKKYTKEKDFLEQINRDLSITRSMAAKTENVKILKASLQEQRLSLEEIKTTRDNILEREKNKEGLKASLQERTFSVAEIKMKKAIILEEEKIIEALKTTLHGRRLSEEEIKTTKNAIQDQEQKIEEERKKISPMSLQLPLDDMAKTKKAYHVDDLVEVRVPLFSFKTTGSVIHNNESLDFNVAYKNDKKSPNNPYISIFIPKISPSENPSSVELSKQPENITNFFIGANFQNILKGVDLKNVAPNAPPNMNETFTYPQENIKTNIFSTLKDPASEKLNIQHIKEHQFSLKDKIKKHLEVELAQPADPEIKYLQARENATLATTTKLSSSQPMSIKTGHISDFEIDNKKNCGSNTPNSIYLASEIELSSLIGASNDTHAHAFVFPNKDINCDDTLYLFPKTMPCEKFKNQKTSTAQVCLKMTPPPHASAENLKDPNWLRKNAVLDENNPDNINIKLKINNVYGVDKNGAISPNPYPGFKDHYWGYVNNPQKILLEEKLKNFFKKEEDHITYSTLDAGLKLFHKANFVKAIDHHDTIHKALLPKAKSTKVEDVLKLISSGQATTLLNNKDLSLKTSKISDLQIQHKKCKKSTSPDNVYAGIEIHPESLLYKSPDSNESHEVIFSNPNFNCEDPKFEQTPQNQKKCREINSHTSAIVACLKLTLPPGTQAQRRDEKWIKQNAYFKSDAKAITVHYASKDLKTYITNDKGAFYEMPIGNIFNNWFGDTLVQGIAKGVSTNTLHSLGEKVLTAKAYASRTDDNAAKIAKIPYNVNTISPMIAKALTTNANAAAQKIMKEKKIDISLLTSPDNPNSATITVQNPKHAIAEGMAQMLEQWQPKTLIPAMWIKNFLDKACNNLYSVTKNPELQEQICNKNNANEALKSLNDDQIKNIRSAFASNTAIVCPTLQSMIKKLSGPERKDFIQGQNKENTINYINTIEIFFQEDASNIFCDNKKKVSLESVINSLKGIKKSLLAENSPTLAITELPPPNSRLEKTSKKLMNYLRRLNNKFGKPPTLELPSRTASDMSTYSDTSTSSNTSTSSTDSVILKASNIADILNRKLLTGPIIEVNECPKGGHVSLNLEPINATIAELHKAGYFSASLNLKSLDFKNPLLKVGCKEPPTISIHNEDIDITCNKLLIEGSKKAGMKGLLNALANNNGLKASFSVKSLFAKDNEENSGFVIKNLEINKDKTLLQKMGLLGLGDFAMNKFLKYVLTAESESEDPITKTTTKQTNQALWSQMLKNQVVSVIGPYESLNNKSIQSIQADPNNPNKVNIQFVTSPPKLSSPP